MEEAITMHAKAHVSFSQIPPFWDGNGRIAHLIPNLILLKAISLPSLQLTQADWIISPFFQKTALNITL
jgi:Fic family protein